MSFLSRVFLFLLFLAITGAAAAWIIGGEVKKHSMEITIEAHRLEVFKWLIESNKIKKWSVDLVDVDSYESENSESKRIIKSDDKEIEFTDRVIRFDEGAALSVQSTSRDVVITQVFHLTQNSSSNGNLQLTDLEYRVNRTLTAPGRFLTSLESDKDFEDRMKKQMRQLKKLIKKEGSSFVPADPDPIDQGSDQPFTGIDDSPPIESENGNEPNRPKKRDFKRLFETG